MARIPETPQDDDFNFDDEDFLRGDVSGGDEGDTGDEGEFKFEDEFAEPGEEEEFDLGEEEFGEEFLEEEEEAGAPGGGPNRTFIIIAGVMIVLFIIGLIAVVLLATSPKGPSPIQLSATYVVAFNSTQSALLAQTQTQSAIELAMTQTAAAASPTPSPTATFTPTPSETPTLSPTPAELNPTDAAATQFFLDQTATAIALAQGPTAIVGAPTIEPALAVQMTATALAQLLSTPIPSNLTPTREVGGAVSGGPTALPGTGLFDDLAQGGTQTFGALFLIALGLVALIVVSRRLRTANGR